MKISIVIILVLAVVLISLQGCGDGQYKIPKNPNAKKKQENISSVIPVEYGGQQK